jgi:hypothetical protein
MCRPTPPADSELRREAAAARPDGPVTLTIAELSIRYELESAALDARLEAERARLDRGRRPSPFGPARGTA